MSGFIGDSLVFVLAGGICVALCSSCSVQKSELLSRDGSVESQAGMAGAPTMDPRLAVAGAGPVTPAVVEAIDERPIGGASLNGGTTGGGTYADAFAKGQLHYVDSVEEIRAHIATPTASILLIAEGSYDFSSVTASATQTAPPKIWVCDQPCVPSTPVAQQTIMANASCEASKYQIEDTHEFLRVRDNKTLIGLGKGATLRNAMISLSNVTNVILRNLAIQDVTGNINGSGYGINLWPGDHIWVDHCTFNDIGRSYFNLSSTLDDTNGQTVAETGYITVTHSDFDGKMDGICGQRSPSVLGTSQVTALTLAYNWFHRSSRYNVQLFGPATWGHVFNNYWSDIDRQGLGVVCGGTVIAQGNVFETTTSAVFTSDSGADRYAFCASGLYGKLYVPMNGGVDEDNLIDSASTLSLNGQPTDAPGVVKPVRRTGHTFTIAAPTMGGASTDAYEVTLIADPTTVAAHVKANAGAGKLF